MVQSFANPLVGKTDQTSMLLNAKKVDRSAAS